MWWYGRGYISGSWLPEEKKANMWPGKGNSGGSWPPAFPRSLGLSYLHFFSSQKYFFLVFGDTMKTTFDLNFDLYQAVKQHISIHKHRSQEKLSIKKASLKLLVNL